MTFFELQSKREDGGAMRSKEHVFIFVILLCLLSFPLIAYGNADIEEDLTNSIDKVEYVHLKDKKGPGKVWNFPALGEGDIDLPMVFEMFKDHENFSPMSIEIEFTDKGPENLEEVNQAVKTSYSYLKSYGFNI